MREYVDEKHTLVNTSYVFGDIVWVEFKSNGTHLQSGTRPAIIIQNNIGNKYSPVVQVVPITSRLNKKHLPTHVFLPANVCGIPMDSIAQCEGSRPVDKRSIKGKISQLNTEYITMIAKACMINMPLLAFLDDDDIDDIRDTNNKLS